MKDNEVVFHKWWKENSIKGFNVIKHEFILGDARNLLKRDVYDLMSSGENSGGAGVIGRIDTIFKYKGCMYVGEIKYMKAPNDFWDAMKVLGYCEYFKWQTGMSYVKPAVLMPLKSIKLEHQIVSNRLKFKIFAIEKSGNKYLLKDMT